MEPFELSNEDLKKQLLEKPPIPQSIRELKEYVWIWTDEIGIAPRKKQRLKQRTYLVISAWVEWLETYQPEAAAYAKQLGVRNCSKAFSGILKKVRLNTGPAFYVGFYVYPKKILPRDSIRCPRCSHVYNPQCGSKS